MVSASTSASARAFSIPVWMGRSCFPKDTRALLATASDAGVKSLVVSSAVDVNNQRKTTWSVGFEPGRRRCEW